MNITYRGFELNAKREKSLGGETMLYYFITRKADGWFLNDSFTSGSETAKEYMPYLKKQVDDYYENPLEFYGDFDSFESVVTEMLYTFTPAEIGAHFQRYAELVKKIPAPTRTYLPTDITE